MKRIPLLIIMFCVLLNSCIPTGNPNPSTEQIFTVFFIGDSEPRMRGNTNDEVSYYVKNLIRYKNDTTVYFDLDGGNKYKLNPELVILAGDISADRSTSVQNDMPIWKTLYDSGIAFIAGFGNHDWEPERFGDGSLGYSLAGHLSNESTKAFCKETYIRSALLTNNFIYNEILPTSANGPLTFYATYKGVKIVNFNTFLYQPSYYYPPGWPLNCNLATGGAGCQIYSSAENQIQRMEQFINADSTSTFLFFQHYPIASESWWNDYGISGTTFTQKKNRLLSMLSKNNKTILLTAHHHSYNKYTHTYNNITFNEYVAPYFGGNNSEDLTKGGGFIALLISNQRGVLDVKRID